MVPPLAAFAILALATSGCAEEPASAAAVMAEPAEIIVEPAELRLAAGGEAELAAQVNDAAGQAIGGAEIRYTVDDGRVLRVSQRGMVTSLGPAAESAVTVASGRSSRRVPVLVQPGAPQRIEKLAGDGQVVTAGTAAGTPLEMRVLDLAGNPVPGVGLVLEDVGGEATVQQTETGDDGRAHFDVAPDARAGSLRLRVRERDTGAPVEVFELAVRSGPPAAVEVLCAARDASRANSSALEIRLQVRDGHGNAVADAELRARLAAGSEAGTAFRTDAGGAARLEFQLPAKARSPTLEVLAGETRVARIALADAPSTCPVAPEPQPAP